MTPERRTTVGVLALAGLIVVLGVALIPTHVSFGAGSVRCGTVWHPDRVSEFARFCGKAGAQQLRASLGAGALLGGLGFVPLLVWRLPRRQRRATSALWVVVFIVTAALALMLLGTTEYSPSGASFQL